MLITMTDLNSLRYNITNAIRYLEIVSTYLIEQDDSSSLCSEVAYWLTTLEMLRGYISVDAKIDETKMPVTQYLDEIKEEIKAAYTVEGKFYKDRVRDNLVYAWSFCKRAKEVIK